ncbi:24202_t:CDS:2 [Gigaspora margarita]|uniref:24202_t:CDS:1 n=1 Tax=Gigaspora margarita TaxID=4874 RepID=A0ABM8VX83_GIGMA|nr:24202_t:CDS:2 [Gigaspora margarita]
MQIKDKVVIITGGASGIGAALARRLILEGAQVVIGDIDQKSGQELLTELNQNNKTNAIFVFCDVTNVDHLRQLFDTAQNTFGGVDIVCNNAGISPIEYFDQTDIWIKIIDINLNAVIKGTQLGIGFLKKRGGGVIINTDKIRVNAIAPGFVDTPMMKKTVKLMPAVVQGVEKLGYVPIDEVVNAFITIILDDKLVGDTIMIPKKNFSQIISKSFL